MKVVTDRPNVSPEPDGATPGSRPAGRELLLEQIVGGGYCIGCGACAAVEGSGLRMRLDPQGRFTPVPSVTSSEPAADLLSVCPFSNVGPDETQVAAELFSPAATFHEKIGFHLGTYAGYVREGDFRDRGSSGGMGKWIGYELMRLGLVDHLVQVVAELPQQTGEVLYRYRVVSDVEEVRRGSRSVYYPVELSEVVAQMQAREGRYAVVGVPCFVKAVRRLCSAGVIPSGRVRYLIGLVCGHLKSTRFAEMLAWQAGIEPGSLRGVDFRKKYPGTNAKQKGMEFTVLENGEEVKSGDIVQNYFGTMYDLGFFKYSACDYCDDVVAETADIAVGDAWLPQYVPDGGGTSLLIIRNPELVEIVERASDEGRLHLEPLDADAAARSQAGGFRHRRDGLAYRLHLKDQRDEWRPEKRVQGREDHLSPADKNKYLMRMAIAAQGDRVYEEAKARGSYLYFERTMKRIIRDYETGDIFLSPPRRVVRRTKRFVKRALKALLGR